MKYTLTQVFRSDKDKNGVALMTKTGKPYTKLALKTTEHGDKWLSGFDGKSTSQWAIGDLVEFTVEQKGDFLNFSVPRVEDILAARLTVIEADILNIKKLLANPLPTLATVDVVNPNDIPF